MYFELIHTEYGPGKAFPGKIYLDASDALPKDFPQTVIAGFSIV